MLTFEQQRLLTPEQVDSYFELLMRRPVQRCQSTDDDVYLNGDYILHGTRRAHEWGE
jgi:hypothetical protein